MIVMKKFTLFLLTAFLVTSITAGQSTVKETRDVKGFTKISYAISGNLKINIGPEFKVVLEGDKGDLDEVITDVSDGRLRIRLDNWRFRFNEKVNAYVTLPVLEGVSVSGSGKAEILDPVRDADDFSMNVSGSGDLIATEIVTDAIDCGISGSGTLVISSGSADRGEISISGSGNCTAPDFEIDKLQVRVSGSGSCFCKAGDSINASISGSGNVIYKGDPSVDARVSGSGRVRSAN